MYFVVYLDVARQWRWTLYAANNRKIADSAEGYFNQTDCVHGINLVASSNGVPIRYV